MHAVECFHLGSGANLPWCGAPCVHRSGVPNHLQETLTSRKHLGQAKAHSSLGITNFLNELQDNCGLGTALAKLKENLTCVAYLLTLSPCQERPPLPLPAFSD